MVGTVAEPVEYPFHLFPPSLLFLNKNIKMLFCLRELFIFSPSPLFLPVILTNYVIIERRQDCTTIAENDYSNYVASTKINHIFPLSQIKI